MVSKFLDASWLISDFAATQKWLFYVNLEE